MLIICCLTLCASSRRCALFLGLAFLAGFGSRISRFTSSTYILHVTLGAAALLRDHLRQIQDKHRSVTEDGGNNILIPPSKNESISRNNNVRQLDPLVSESKSQFDNFNRLKEESNILKEAGNYDCIYTLKVNDKYNLQPQQIVVNRIDYLLSIDNK